MPNLTKRYIDAARYEGDGSSRDVRWDGAMPGFGLRVYPSKRKSFVLSYRNNAGRKRMIVLGAYGLDLTLDQARDRAISERAKLVGGADPLAERQSARAEAETRDTFEAVAGSYIERYVKPNKRARSAYEDERIIHREMIPRWGSRKISEISRRDVIELLDGITDRGSPIMANRTLSLARKLFGWAVERDIVDASPVDGDQLLDEEGVSSRPLADELCESPDRGIAPQQVEQQLLDRLGPERHKGDLLVVGLAEPLRLVLGAEVDQQQHVRAGDDLDELLDEGIAPRVDPVQVVEEHDHRLDRRLDEPSHEVEELSLADLRLHPGGGLLGIGDAEEVEHEWQHLAEAVVQQQEGSGYLGPRLIRRIRLPDPEVAAEQLEDGEERDRPCMHEAVRLVHLGAPCATPLHELEAEAALSDAGVRHDPDDLPLPLDGAGKGGVESGDLVGSTDEA